MMGCTVLLCSLFLISGVSSISVRSKGDNLDGGLNLSPMWDPVIEETHKADHDSALMEDHAKMLKRAKHFKKHVSWLPFAEYTLDLTDLVPKSDPMKPEATSEAEDILHSLSELGLSLTNTQSALLKESNSQVQKQFVYPRLDADATIFSGKKDDAVSDYLAHGGFRYSVDGKDVVANRAVKPAEKGKCAKRSITYSDHFCPNIRFPQSVPQEEWHPFPGKDNKEITYQYVGAHAKDDLFDPDDYSSDPRASHFLGAFIFKKEGEEHLEWRCQDTGFGFLPLKDLHFHLGVVEHHKSSVGKGQTVSKHEKAPKPLINSMRKSLLTANPDMLSMVEASKTVSYVYPKKNSLAECSKSSHQAAHCFEAKGGFSFITAGGSVLKVSTAPASNMESAKVEQAPFVFSSGACPSVLMTEKLHDCDWHQAPAEYNSGGDVQYIWLGATDAHKTKVFGACNNKKTKKFAGAFVFRQKTGKKATPQFSWRCLKQDDASRHSSYSYSHHDAFNNANTGEQSMVSNMVNDINDFKDDSPSGMVEESIDEIPNSQTITIEEKHDYISDLKRMFPGMKITHDNSLEN